MAKRPPGSARTSPQKRSSPPARRSPFNRLLAALPPSERERIASLSRDTSLKFHDFLHRKSEPVEYVYFPAGGICSLVTPLADGSMVEMAMVGSEGLVGASAAINGHIAQETALVQVGSEFALRMPIDDFRREMERPGPFPDLVTRYGQGMLAFIMQSVACNAMHPVEQRLCRWLLMARDRLDADQFPLTQELLATMLGISRPTVTLVAGALRKAGLIEYRHGSMTILNRQGLESGSCECYRVVNEAFDTLVPELMR
jgi:CRP-like cAMP-binding protein